MQFKLGQVVETPVLERTERSATFMPGHVPFMPIVDNNGILVGEWQSSVYSAACDDKMYCCLTCFCPCVSLGQTMARVGSCGEGYVVMVSMFYLILIIFFAMWLAHLQDNVVLNVFFYLMVFIAVLTFLTTGAVVGFARAKIRSLFKIPGSEISDVISATFCSCCVLAQMAGHVQANTPGQCTLRFKDTLPGYDV
ncbi:hypothetical protein LEN26_002922 [Aphanomyces euteiches]|nr:hypothetical protein AeMF1_018380 [Aphanomyces euteiches]KAH9131291.1 hypothetical protein LEN26_007755 [Aphanomyces euteiches]KAH9158511.1 hypothetical protein LEN26_002922 [Aphanomyces euteiches]KAH9191069.1 hypothetical protein AeNC1_006946 [Aphanomyces euteiches]